MTTSHKTRLEESFIGETFTQFPLEYITPQISWDKDAWRSMVSTIIPY